MMTQQIINLLHFESYSARKLFDDKTLLTMTVVLYHYYKRHGHYIYVIPSLNLLTTMSGFEMTST